MQVNGPVTPDFSMQNKSEWFRQFSFEMCFNTHVSSAGHTDLWFNI
jgi:hypothetical protein